MIQTFIDSEPRLLADGRIILNVVYVDNTAGLKRATEVIVSTPTIEGVKSALRAERDKAVPTGDLLKQLQAGEFDLTEVPPVPPDPDLEAFITAKSALQRALQLVQLGIVSPDSKELADLKSFVVSLYKPEFLAV